MFVIRVNIAIILIIIWIWYFQYNDPNCEEYQYEYLDTMNKFKTGDIILFHNLNTLYAPLFMNYFTHTGIVWQNPYDGKLYLFEALPRCGMNLKEIQKTKGVYISLLNNRIRKYKGYVYYKELEHKLDENISYNFFEFIKYSINNLTYDVNIKKNIINKIIGIPCTKKTNCGELVFLSLIKLNLLSTNLYDKKIINYIKYISEIKLLKNNSYKNIIKIIDHPF